MCVFFLFYQTMLAFPRGVLGRLAHLVVKVQHTRPGNVLWTMKPSVLVQRMRQWIAALKYVQVG